MRNTRMNMSSSCRSGTVGVSVSLGFPYSRNALARTNQLDTLLSTDHVMVQRGLAEFRGARPVLFLASESFVAMPVDGCDPRLIDELRQTFDTAPLRLAITARRAWALGIKTEEAVTLRLKA